MLEFALASTVGFMLLFGILSGGYLVYQNSALHDGATAGARMASIETSLVTPTSGQYCESGLPTPVEKAVAQAAPQLTVNPAPLCASSATATQLTQSPSVPGDVNITLTCGGTCGAPTSVAVALAFATKGIAPPFSFAYNMSASSQDPAGANAVP